jgi:transposase
MNKTDAEFQRVIGFDVHPDSFTAAMLRGPTPAAAVTEAVFNKVPLARLLTWAQKHTTPQDVFVLEASGNSFQVVRLLASVQRLGLVLESCQLGKLKEAHANNDRISAVRIGKAFLAGTAKRVWVPDPLTQERRDLWHAYEHAVKTSTRENNSALSYLSDRGVRLPQQVSLSDPDIQERLRKALQWTPRQWQIIEGKLMAFTHATEKREHWRSLIAQEVATDPMLLSLTRLCGIRDVVAFALGALIGDIKRFAHPGSLVKYVGLNPAFDDSGKGQWHGGIGGHGRKDLRCLLVESAQAILKTNDELARWGKKLIARKGSYPLAVAAVARKLAISVWYMMMGKEAPVEEIDDRLARKVTKIISQIGDKGLKEMNQTRPALREQMKQLLKTGRTYVLTEPVRKKDPAKVPENLAQEYGLA